MLALALLWSDWVKMVNSLHLVKSPSQCSTQNELWLTYWSNQTITLVGTWILSINNKTVWRVKNDETRTMSFVYCSGVFIPAGNYMFKVNNRNTRTRCLICSKLTPCSSVFYCQLWTGKCRLAVKFEHLQHVNLCL